MHSYGSWPDYEFDTIEYIASVVIGGWLRKWGRVNVRQTKEKFGTVRVYCSLGWSCFHEIFYPGHCFIRWPKWMMKLDFFLSYTLHGSWLLGHISYPIHARLYRWRYKKAVEKWPDLRDEILDCADFGELLEGL